MFKNKIITDLSGVKFEIARKWGDSSDEERKGREPEIDSKVIPTEDITKVSPEGKLIKKFDDFE